MLQHVDQVQADEEAVTYAVAIGCEHSGVHGEMGEEGAVQGQLDDIGTAFDLWVGVTRFDPLAHVRAQLAVFEKEVKTRGLQESGGLKAHLHQFAALHPAGELQTEAGAVLSRLDLDGRAIEAGVDKAQGRGGLYGQPVKACASSRGAQPVGKGHHGARLDLEGVDLGADAFGDGIGEV